MLLMEGCAMLPLTGVLSVLAHMCTFHMLIALRIFTAHSNFCWGLRRTRVRLLILQASSVGIIYCFYWDNNT